MSTRVYKQNFLDNKSYSIEVVGTKIKIRLKNQFIELDSFQILPDFLENLYD